MIHSAISARRNAGGSGGGPGGSGDGGKNNGPGPLPPSWIEQETSSLLVTRSTTEL